MPNDNTEEIGDPCVPADLLEIHVALEAEGMTAKEFRGLFADEADHES